MKIIIIIILSVLVFPQISIAEEQFIKYRNFLVPIGSEEEPVNTSSSSSSGSSAPTTVLSFGPNSISNRTDEGATLTGTFISGNPADTWFILQEDEAPELPPNTISNSSTRGTPASIPLPLTNADCLGQRQNQQFLGTGQINQYNLNGLDDNTTYNVGFCSISSNGEQAILGGVVTFSTKRNESTEVEYSCRDNLRFSGEDGPLNIEVAAEGINTDNLANLAIIEIDNGTNNSNVDISIIPHPSFRFRLDGEVPRRVNNAIYTVRAERVSIIRDRQFIESEYNVELGDGNWSATFSCTTLNCDNPVIVPRTCLNSRNIELTTTLFR